MALELTSSPSSQTIAGYKIRAYHKQTSALIFNDLYSEDLEVCISSSIDHYTCLKDMDCANEVEDVSAVMTKVLAHLHRITEHLRQQDENEAANHIAKHALSMASTFNDATAHWSMENGLMAPVPSRCRETSFSIGGTSPHKARNNAESWAAVAATANDDDVENQLIKFRPSDGLKRRVNFQESVVIEKDMRVIWIKGWDRDRPLTEVTERLLHGALYSMAYCRDHAAACIIFQHPEGAERFLDDNEDCIRTTGVSLFGRKCQMMVGLPYPVNEGIQRMDHPWVERRRLTFARSQLFANGLTEQQFKKDLHELVGQQNVELVWLFNTGNATVIFSAVPIARLVKSEFIKLSKGNGPYMDVQVTFSHDPCERPINLTTQMITGHSIPRQRSDSNRMSISVSYNGSYQRPLGGGISDRRLSATATSPRIDTDGWQTVSKKR